MFIPSNRLRRVDTPDVPTPGVVPPVVPPVAPPGYTAPATAAPVEPGAPVAAAPGGPKKPMSKGLLFGLIGGGAALVIIAIIAVVVLVLPSLLGGGSGDKTDVADINGEPDTTWKFDWVGDNDEEFLESSPTIVAVGDDQALVWATFDPTNYSTGNSAGWYEGYDEQYEDGYDAGLEYLAAYDAYWEDFSGDVPYPDQEDYFPEGAYNDYDEWLGFQDGFYDGAYEMGEGASQKEKPVDPDFTPSLTLLNAANGEEEWTIDLTDAIDGADFQSSIQAYDIAGTNAVLVSASVIDDDSYSYTAVTLDKGNGKVISTLESDGPISARGFDGEVIIAVTDEDGDETTVGRYKIDAIDDDPNWDVSVDGYASLYLDGEFLSIYSDDDEYLVVNAQTGEEAEWADDVDEDVYYAFLGSQLLRIEDGEIEGFNTNGDSVWEDSVDSEMSPFASDGVLLVAEEDGEGYSELQRINPGNGSEMWGEAYGDEFDYVAGVQGNNLLLASGSKIIVLDLGNGEEKFSQKVGDFYGVWEGANQYYVTTGDELAAYSYGEKGDIWSLDLDDSEGITQLGNHLVLIDYDKGTLNGLGS